MKPIEVAILLETEQGGTIEVPVWFDAKSGEVFQAKRTIEAMNAKREAARAEVLAALGDFEGTVTTSDGLYVVRRTVREGYLRPERWVEPTPTLYVKSAR